MGTKRPRAFEDKIVVISRGLNDWDNLFDSVNQAGGLVVENINRRVSYYVTSSDDKSGLIDQANKLLIPIVAESFLIDSCKSDELLDWSKYSISFDQEDHVNKRQKITSSTTTTTTTTTTTSTTSPSSDPTADIGNASKLVEEKQVNYLEEIRKAIDDNSWMTPSPIDVEDDDEDVEKQKKAELVKDKQALQRLYCSCIKPLLQQTEKLESWLKEEGVFSEKEIEFISSLIKLGISAKIQDKDDDDDDDDERELGYSKFGGSPHFPKKQATSLQNQVKDKLFVAQFNMNDFKDVFFHRNLLPKNGILYFFITKKKEIPKKKGEDHIEEGDGVILFCKEDNGKNFVGKKNSERRVLSISNVISLPPDLTPYLKPKIEKYNQQLLKSQEENKKQKEEPDKAEGKGENKEDKEEKDKEKEKEKEKEKKNEPILIGKLQEKYQKTLFSKESLEKRGKMLASSVQFFGYPVARCSEIVESGEFVIGHFDNPLQSENNDLTVWWTFEQDALKNAEYDNGSFAYSQSTT